MHDTDRYYGMILRPCDFRGAPQIAYSLIMNLLANKFELSTHLD